jgi:hypothetical protein
MIRRLAWVGVAFSILIVLIATLRAGGTELSHGWSFDLTSGEAAFAELLQNLLLFVPLGLTLTLAGVPPRATVIMGAALSFTVEFMQQWIPGRDPSVGDIVANTVSTALGVALVFAAHRWLWTPPQRSAQQALGLAAAAILIWFLSGLVFRPIFPDPPYRALWRPDFNFWGHYRGKVLAAHLGGETLTDSALVDGQFLLKSGQLLEVTATLPNPIPQRTAPLVAFVDTLDTKVAMFSVDHRDLALRYHMKAIELTLEDPDLRWHGAMALVPPLDTFVARAWRGEHRVCMSVNSARRCGFGYTIGDGWKLIYYPESFRGWMYALLNMSWLGGWTIGIGWWTGRAMGRGARSTQQYKLLPAPCSVLVALLAIPMITGLKTTPIHEWIGALGGLALGYAVSFRAAPRAQPTYPGWR